LGPLTVTGDATVTEDLDVLGDLALTGNATLGGTLSIAGNILGNATIEGNLAAANADITNDLIVGDELSANSASFVACLVDNSPVRTFANSPDDGGGGGMEWPPAGIGVSTGTGWSDDSIDATNPVFAGTVTSEEHFRAYGYSLFDLASSNTSMGVAFDGTTPLITLVNASGAANSKAWIIAANPTQFYMGLESDAGDSTSFLAVTRNLNTLTETRIQSPFAVGAYGQTAVTTIGMNGNLTTQGAIWANGASPTGTAVTIDFMAGAAGRFLIGELGGDYMSLCFNGQPADPNRLGFVAGAEGDPNLYLDTPGGEFVFRNNATGFATVSATKGFSISGPVSATGTGTLPSVSTTMDYLSGTGGRVIATSDTGSAVAPDFLLIALSGDGSSYNEFLRYRAATSNVEFEGGVTWNPQYLGNVVAGDIDLNNVTETGIFITWQPLNRPPSANPDWAFITTWSSGLPTENAYTTQFYSAWFDGDIHFRKQNGAGNWDAWQKISTTPS
jgi:hypothetical protein